MARRISNERKTAYYIGMGLQILGGLLFASTFVTFLTNFGDFTNFEANAKSSGFRAFGGMVLMIVGNMVRGIGARGLAGAGVLLDPEKARKDLQPYSRMVGAMIKDAVDESEINVGSKPDQVIMLKCRECGTLNQESAKFCQECGAKF